MVALAIKDHFTFHDAKLSSYLEVIAFVVFENKMSQVLV